MKKSWPLAFFSLAIGITLAYYQIWLITLSVILLLLIGGAVFKQYARQVFLCLLLLLGGILYTQIRIPDIPSSMQVIQGFQCSGKVQDFPMVDGEKTIFVVRTDRSSSWEKKIRVVCYFKTDLSRGDHISIRGVLKPPLRPGNPGEFNYPLYLSHSGIYYNLSVKHAGDLRLLAREKGPLSWVDKFRARGELLTKELLPARESAILLGMLLGSREGIDDEQYNAFQKTGIIHLFSVSGLHVGFLLLLVGWIASLLGIPKGKRFFSGVAVLLLYGTMIAWPICVIRSIFMGILGLLAYYYGRKNDILNALAVAGVVNLILDPASLFTISFQLTYLATWGILFIFPRLRQACPYKGWGWDLVWLPISAELAVMPLIAYYFNILTPVSIITNILVSYVSGAAVIFGFISLFVAAFLPFLVSLFLYPAGFCIELILLIVNWVQYLPGGYIWVATPAVGMIILYYTSILMGSFALSNPQYRKYAYPALGILALFMAVLLIPASFHQRGLLEVDFIDVGQGDAVLLKTPRGKFVLLDGGGSTMYDVGTNTVLPYLHRRGIRSLRLLINSHPDNDHLQGVERVAKEIPVKIIAVPESLLHAEEYRLLQRTAAHKNIALLGLSAGQAINIEEGLSITVLHPEGKTYLQNNNNNQSIVLRISYGEFSILLTGDIEKEAMQALLDDGRLHNTTVVKVPHHGSKGSLLPAFYQQIQAHYAVISVGNNNLFGHPNPATLAMLEGEKLKILRTDQNGAIIILSDGQKMMIKPTIAAGKD